MQPFVLGYFCKVEVPTSIIKTGAIFRRTEKFLGEAGNHVATWSCANSI